MLSPERRRALIGWGRALVVEDDYDAEHRYDRAPVPALQGLVPDRVVYAGSVSKTLAPGLRLGWVVAPATCARRSPGPSTWPISATPCSTSWCSPASSPRASSNATCAACGSGSAPAATRCSAALREHLPHAQVLGVAAGLHLLVTLPGSDDVELAAAADAAGVLVHPLSTHRITPGPPGLVLGYAAQAPDRIREGDRPARRGVPFCRTPVSARVTARA